MIKSNDDMRIKVLGKIYELKHTIFGDININCNFNNTQYELLLMTSDCADDQGLMELIGKWRKENEMWFYSQFPVTVERTTKWFNERVIGALDRLLFMIKVNNDYIGHVGLFRFDFEDNTCEIDNIVRGESRYPGIMEDAIKNMMEWGKCTLGLRSYSLKTFSHNERALNLYKRLGFVEVKRVPLVYTQGDDGLELVEAPEGDDAKAEKYEFIMKLSDKVKTS